MPWLIDPDRPLYLQLVEKLEQRIVSGQYKVGVKLPSVRDLATEAAVNPNTMQKAMSILEEKGLVFAKRTSGCFITEDAAVIKAVRNATALEEARQWINKMNSMGFKLEESIDLLKLAASWATAIPSTDAQDDNARENKELEDATEA